MKKRVLALLLGAAMTLTLLAGCGGDKPAADAGKDGGAAADGAKEKYGLCISHMTNSFVTTVANAAQAKADELGVELTVFDGEKDQAKQISQIESAIQQGYKGIMIEPISVDGVKPAVQEAVDAGLAVITVVQKMTEQDLVSSFVGGDDMQAGVMEMEKACEALGGKGSIAILYGPMGSDAQLIRKQGYDEVLAKYPDVKVVFEQTANWVTDEALTLTENWLQTGTQIDAIVSQNDGMAMGALKAVEDAGKKDSIAVYGMDAVEDAVAAIADGRLDGSVSQNTAGQGSLGMEILYKVAQGETVDATNLTEVIWVDKSNVADFQ